MILLDTNVVSEPMRSNPDRSVLTWLDAQSVESLYLATVSLSELLLGIASLPAGKRRSALAGALDEQIISLFAERIVPFDIAGAEAYAEIVTRARRRGHSIAVADAQIAAIAASTARIKSAPRPLPRDSYQSIASASSASASG